MSNNGKTQWRPSVSKIQIYSDEICLEQISATYLDQSGSFSDDTDGSMALDKSDTTKWRPQCGPFCSIGEAWVTFSTESEIKCVKASNLGEANGDSVWNGGIKVEIQDRWKWTTVLESHSGNYAIGIES